MRRAGCEPACGVVGAPGYSWWRIVGHGMAAGHCTELKLTLGGATKDGERVGGEGEGGCCLRGCPSQTFSAGGTRKPFQQCIPSWEHTNRACHCATHIAPSGNSPKGRVAIKPDHNNTRLLHGHKDDLYKTW